MEQFLNLILPFFLIIGLGFAAGWFKWMPEGSSPALTRFVMVFALPPFLFQILMKTPFQEIANFRFLGYYTTGSLAIFAIGFVIFRMVHREDRRNATYFAQACAMPNTGYLGLPMLSGLLGPGAAVIVTLCLMIELLVIAPLTLLIAGSGKNGGASNRRDALRQITKSIVTNSLILTAALGVTASFFNFQPPSYVDATLTLIAKGAGPAALFTIGMTLAQRTLSSGRLFTNGSFLSMTLLKLIVHPLIVFALLVPLAGFDYLTATAAVLAAALPIAANAYMLSARSGANLQAISTGILISSALAVATFTTALALLR